MRRGRLLVLTIALIAAIGAAFVARSMISAPTVRTVEKTVGATEVLVAARSIALGDAVQAGDLKWQDWPDQGLSPELITQQKDPDAATKYVGAIARAPFIAGEPINPQKLIKLGEGGVMAAVLPKGMRAVSTPISDDSAAGGFILPNDRVDVILSRRLEVGNKDQQVSETVLRDVRVLAIGQTMETSGNDKTVEGKTATLEVTPHQAETLALAESMGQIALSLRSLADTQNRGNEPTADLQNQDNSSVRMLKYGTPSRVYGIN